MAKRIRPTNAVLSLAIVAAAFGFTSLIRAQQPAAPAVRVAVDADDIGGVVTSARGPEAGVWVIAEAQDLPTKFRKIVVTDDRGRYVVPDLPQSSYQVWVRGYGLVDSTPVRAARGQQLALRAVVAPDARAAAQVYPANYWMSLMRMPPASAFPMQIRTPPAPGGRGGGVTALGSQDDWVNNVKGCIVCHQMGNKATREIPSQLGVFPSSIDAWDRRLRSGQLGPGMYNTVIRLGSREQGLGFYADWTDRIAAGELPEAPPRPQGVERNIVLSSWDVGRPNAFIHEGTSSDKRKPTVNAYGEVFGVDWHNNTMVILDPLEHRKSEVTLPTLEDPTLIGPGTQQTMEFPSPYWGEEIIIYDIATPDTPMVDARGNVWTSNRARRPQNPAFCYDGSNAYSKHWPLRENRRQAAYYDPKTKQMQVVDTCFGTHHLNFGYDKDDNLYFHGPQAAGSPAILGWVNTRAWYETRDPAKSQGWCPAFLDTNGDGRIDPKVDKPIVTAMYAVTQSPADVNEGIVWASAPATNPGRIIRFRLGSNPPETCVSEVYEPPYNNPAMPGVKASLPRAVDVDTNGLVWVVLSASSDVASFDRRKCRVLSGPAAETGQHCPEGWTIYPQPGPTFKSVDMKTNAEWAYYLWVDRYNILGLGANIPIITGTNSDSFMALNPATKQWTIMRVPYPLGFYTRGMDGRIDDPRAGWKGRGLWGVNGSRAVWHTEGGRERGSQMVHFQLRPDPLAR